MSFELTELMIYEKKGRRVLHLFQKIRKHVKSLLTSYDAPRALPFTGNITTIVMTLPTTHNTPAFNAKYRRKCLLLLLLLLFHGCFSELSRATAYNCTAHSSYCQNDGQCQKDGQCLCADGWQGPECQFCGGKVRLFHTFGTIHDGFGNYSVSVKCSWLIDARQPHGNRHHALNSQHKPTIRIHLREFATECGWDHLYIYDGDSVDSPLLAVFSGLMYRNNFSIRAVPQVIARSGTALLHFFSDDAYNMSGFNLSYKIDGCSSVSEDLECSGHGVCKYGDCVCDRLFKGEGCQIEACPNNCSMDKGQGLCNLNEERCICNEGFGGDDCGQLKGLGVWTSVHPKHSPTPPGTASHGAAVWRDTLHIIGGESYGRGELMTTYDFNGNVWETMHVEDSSGVPERRYGASTVMYGDKIFIYGGVVGGRDISNELWAFDVSAKTWENITVKTDLCNSTTAINMMCGPLYVAGHTATLVPGFGEKTNYQYMVVIFGHSPKYGYLNTVQEFNFATREWKIVETYGHVVKGGFGHSAAFDFLTEKVYVHGGIVSESESSQVLSSKLYAYEPSSRIWTLLSAAPSARLLHTANFLNPGLMIVFGGNTHNDTSQSYGAKCYSRDLLVYDVYCDSWHTQEMPINLQADLARFGHSAVVFEDALYIYGGFNGQLLNDMLRFNSGYCSFYTKQEKCTSGRPGIKCIWDVQKMRCIPITQVQKSAIFGREQYDYVVCPSKSRLTMTLEILNDVSRCQEFSNCQSCTANTFGCAYCGNGICTKERCRETTSITTVFYEATTQQQHSQFSPSVVPMMNIKQLENCPQSDDFLLISVCEKLHSCYACSGNMACSWDSEHNRCRPHIPSTTQVNRTLDEIICPPPCTTLTTCLNCTEEDCIWCQNEQRCVDRNAYTASFPYGQCREWTTHTAKCRSIPFNSGSTTTALSSSQCGFYNSCTQCLDDPACGWCDDGSNTGLGKCVVGGALAPSDSSECPIKHWFFTSCPRCNCNGHSHCLDFITCEQPCSNLTNGSHCEKCLPGYWGNPINGGHCQKCDCNTQGEKCHSDTGKCYCNTKGIVGDHCEKCDTQNHYHGDPIKSSCYYELTIDYQFTFNLSKKEDRHFTKINFRNSPQKSEIDADFSITCSVPAKMDISVKRTGFQEKLLFVGINCSTFRHRFPKTEYSFGHSPDDNSSLTTFYVFVHDFQPPIWIQIAFSQYPKLNLQQFFITFSTCFLLLLLMAAVLWKIKQKYDMFRRRQRLFVEMEQMASRPFSQVLVDIENRENIDLTQTMEGITHLTKKRKKDCPSPIALEPCSGNRAAVLSLLVRLPTGGIQHAPAGQSAGLAVASALVTLGNPRRPSIEHPKEQKSKRKQSQHPDSCT